jgi:hypothetical protein
MDKDSTPALPTVPLTELIPGLPKQYDYDAGIQVALAGQGYRYIAQAMGTTREYLKELRHKYVPFNAILSQARANGLDELFDDLRYIVEDQADVDHRKLKVMFEANKFYLACSDPKKYGDRMNLVIEEKVDLKGSLEQAKSRVLTVIGASTHPAQAETQATENHSG